MMTGRLIESIDRIVENVLANNTAQSNLMAPYFPFDDNTAGEPLTEMERRTR